MRRIGIFDKTLHLWFSRCTCTGHVRSLAVHRWTRLSQEVSFGSHSEYLSIEIYSFVTVLQTSLQQLQCGLYLAWYTRAVESLGY